MYKQAFLFPDMDPAPEPDPPTTTRCPGCGARPGEWRVSKRFRWVFGGLGLCEECVSDRDVVSTHVRDYRPEDPVPCEHAIGSDEKIAVMARRAAAGLSIFSSHDNLTSPAPFKQPTGAPDHQAAPGETGVERCGKGFRARPFWRGRKWPLGVFDTEGEARDRVKEFWRNHPIDDDRPPPILWLPTLDEDSAIAIEYEHYHEWRIDLGLRPSAIRSIARGYRSELRKRRVRLPAVDVFNGLEERLRSAADVTLYSQAEDSALMGV